MNMMNTACARIAVIVFSMALASHIARASTVQLDDAGDHFAIAPQTGALCVVSSAKDALSLYPILSSKGVTDGRIDRTVGRQPVDVFCRAFAGKSWFIVACSGDKTLWILDAATLSVVKTISVAHAPMSVSSALSGKSPYVFYGGHEGLGCVDLRDFTDHPDLTPPNQGMTGFDDICVSSDGRLIYSRRTTQAPTGRTICSIEEPASGPPIVKSLGYTHESVDRFRADPFGPFVSFNAQFGGEADKQNAAAGMPAAPSCYLLKRPLILSLQQGVLHFYSYNTHKELATVVVQPGVNPNQRPAPGRVNRGGFGAGVDQMVLADEQHGNVLCCAGSAVQIIELSSVDLPNEPLLGVTVDGNTVLNPGSPGTLAIKKLNPAASVELKDPKSGMKLTGSTFSWTPTASDVGEFKISFRIFSGEFERIQTVTLAVRRPEIDLPFVPAESLITDDGKFALLLGQSEGGNRRMPYRQPQMQQANAGSDLVLVDLNSRTIAAKRMLPKSIHAIAIDAQYAYAAATDSDAVYMYSLKDLSDVRKIFASSTVRQLVTAGGRLYVAPQQGEASAYSVPDLKPMDPKPQSSQFAGGYNPFAQQLVPVRNELGWELNGVVYDAAMSHILRLKSPTGLIEFNQGNFNPGFNNNNNGQQWATGWGLSIQNDRLMRLPSQTLGSIHGTSPLFLRDIPAVATLLVESAMNQQQPQQPPRVTTALLFFDLVSANKQAMVVLSDEVRENQQNYGGYPGQPGQAILTAPGRVAVLAQDKIYVVETSSLDKTKFPNPPELSCEPGVKIINPASATVIGFSAGHLKSPVEFSLDPDVKGLDIDKSTGKLTVDGPALAAKAAEQLSQNLGQQMMYFQPGVNGQPVQRTPQQAIDAMVEGPAARYTALTGKKPDGIPMLVRINVVALDGDQQKVTFEFAGLLCVPAQKVIELVNAHQAEQAANQRRMQQQQEEMFGNHRRAATQPVDGSVQKQLDDLKAQLAELQKQNTELAAQNKMLKEMVMDQKKPAQ